MIFFMSFKNSEGQVFVVDDVPVGWLCELNCVGDILALLVLHVRVQ